MDIVVDTNVFTKALFESEQWCQKVLLLEAEGTIKFVFNEFTATEVLCVIHDLLEQNGADKNLTYRIMSRFMKIFCRSKIVQCNTFSSLCALDHNDDKFINCAIDGAADYIVSENGQHLTADIEPIIKKEYGKSTKIRSAFQF